MVYEDETTDDQVDPLLCSLACSADPLLFSATFAHGRIFRAIVECAPPHWLERWPAARRCSRLFEESPFTPGHNMRVSSRLRRAAAAVELAVLLPFLMFLFVIAVDWSRVFYASVIVSNCARNGALSACDPTTQASSPYFVAG